MLGDNIGHVAKEGKCGGSAVIIGFAAVAIILEVLLLLFLGLIFCYCCVSCSLGTELEEQSSETATTVAIVMTADEGIFTNCGDLYVPLRIISSSS
ncbi:hypothetical protein Q7C36_004129 [Tachysurus vachellii]|uniref:Uncharacterized protein n=1 Tax=Tachysurus vachellii TaxID=175792 RepID=A0AA88NLS9_TACVA|nr:hypothetical protein Q7C36_004129 [Tachysurus vachellii]